MKEFRRFSIRYFAKSGVRTASKLETTRFVSKQVETLSWHLRPEFTWLCWHHFYLSNPLRILNSQNLRHSSLTALVLSVSSLKKGFACFLLLARLHRELVVIDKQTKERKCF